MSLDHVIEQPEHPTGSLRPDWGNRFTALEIMKLYAPRLLKAGTSFIETGELLRRAFPHVNILTSHPVGHTDQSHYAFALARQDDMRSGNFSVISLLDIVDPANIQVVAFYLALNGGDGVSFLAGDDLLLISEGRETPLYPYAAPADTVGRLHIETYDYGYRDDTVTSIVRHINGATGHTRLRSNPLHKLGDWLTSPEEVVLIRPGRLDTAWFAPLLAAAAMVGATALTLEDDGCCLTPRDKPLAYAGQEIVRPLLLVHAGIEDRLRHEVEVACGRI